MSMRSRRYRRSMRIGGRALEESLVHGKMGDMYTKRFLKSKHVNMVSEGDFISRVRCLCIATYSLPFQLIWVFYFIYARFAVQIESTKTYVVPGEDNYLFKDQINLLNIFVVLQLYHVLLLSITMIVMLNQTLGIGTTIFTAIYNFLFISEILLYGSFIFILDWIGILHKFKDASYVWEMIKTQWMWLIGIIFLLKSFRPLIRIFKHVNMWNREWIRIDRYRKTEDKENAFVFKTWVTPGEIKSRRAMIIAGWFVIILASVFEITDVFLGTHYETTKYIILIFGYIVFLGAYVVPYNKLSLIFFWLNQTFILGLLIYALYLIQNQAWQSGNWYMYFYALLILPWYISLKAAIRYTWTIKDAEEIKAIVLNMFENKDDFEKFLEQRKENRKVEHTSV
ncbi:hypothetical protein SGLAD_v1c06990 [Spiroplasma gladiatoris]|uniref:Transmembrane protein n=1 Tax=Spiroplasma gladiatoris TaxID=2143 RepID=A0A4P7AJC3_9MOLU|nr:hypothetical protein [Spiroplasma gladiatoris]QBQ07898.1 hypothetical protein SGLAD_v1c06990 [Spiroplasma gladiatoris]